MFDGYLLASVGRLVVGLVFLAAGVQKARSPHRFTHSLQSYGLLPRFLVGPVSYGLPALEILVGCGLVLGLGARALAVLSAVLLLAFVAATTLALKRGAKVDCGCFGATTGKWRTAWSLLGRDAGLAMALAPVILYGSGYGFLAGLAISGQLTAMSLRFPVAAPGGPSPFVLSEPDFTFSFLNLKPTLNRCSFVLPVLAPSWLWHDG